MKAQKLKTFSDFLKRAEIIPHALLIITENDSEDCENAIHELSLLDYEIPFYELNLSENPNLKEELDRHYEIEGLPTFIYFRGKNMIRKINGFERTNNFPDFLNNAIHLD